MKKNQKYIFYLLLLCSLLFCFTYFIGPLWGDEIWNYGFAYNIATGLIPYKDFNMVITPLYHFIAAIFIKIFGHHLYSLHLFNNIIIATTVIITSKKLKYRNLLLAPIIIIHFTPSYNVLCTLFIILILNLLDSNIKNKENIISLIVSLLFLTKQTIGLCLLIPLVYYNKNKIKSLATFMIPILIFTIYLILNNALYKFIDYCFLGLINFGKKNTLLLLLPLEIMICIIIIYFIIKSKFKNKQLTYILMYQIITIPICDGNHFVLGIIPILYYILSSNIIKNKNLKCFIPITICLIILLKPNTNFNLYKNNNSFLYKRNLSTYGEEQINSISNYMNNNREKYDYIFLLSGNAYYSKLNIKYKLTKYDLINNGNMGYQGDKKYIKEIDNYCKKHSCMFILYTYEEKINPQTNLNILKYIKKEYTKKENVDGYYDIYTN